MTLLHSTHVFPLSKLGVLSEWLVVVGVTGKIFESSKSRPRSYYHPYITTVQKSIYIQSWVMDSSCVTSWLSGLVQYLSKEMYFGYYVVHTFLFSCSDSKWCYKRDNKHDHFRSRHIHSRFICAYKLSPIKPKKKPTQEMKAEKAIAELVHLFYYAIHA